MLTEARDVDGSCHRAQSVTMTDAEASVQRNEDVMEEIELKTPSSPIVVAADVDDEVSGCLTTYFHYLKPIAYIFI